MSDELDQKLEFFTKKHTVELDGLEIMTIICGITMHQLLLERNNIKTRTPPSQGMGGPIERVRAKLEAVNPDFFKKEVE